MEMTKEERLQWAAAHPFGSTSKGFKPSECNETVTPKQRRITIQMERKAAKSEGKTLRQWKKDQKPHEPLPTDVTENLDDFQISESLPIKDVEFTPSTTVDCHRYITKLKNREDGIDNLPTFFHSNEGKMLEFEENFLGITPGCALYEQNLIKLYRRANMRAMQIMGTATKADRHNLKNIRYAYENGGVIPVNSTVKENLIKELAWLITHSYLTGLFLEERIIYAILPGKKVRNEWNEFIEGLPDVPDSVKTIFVMDENGGFIWKDWYENTRMKKEEPKANPTEDSSHEETPARVTTLEKRVPNIEEMKARVNGGEDVQKVLQENLMAYNLDEWASIDTASASQMVASMKLSDEDKNSILQMIESVEEYKKLSDEDKKIARKTFEETLKELFEMDADALKGVDIPPQPIQPSAAPVLQPQMMPQQDIPIPPQPASPAPVVVPTQQPAENMPTLSKSVTEEGNSFNPGNMIEIKPDNTFGTKVIEKVNTEAKINGKPVNWDDIPEMSKIKAAIAECGKSYTIYQNSVYPALLRIDLYDQTPAGPVFVRTLHYDYAGYLMGRRVVLTMDNRDIDIRKESFVEPSDTEMLKAIIMGPLNKDQKAKCQEWYKPWYTNFAKAKMSMMDRLDPVEIMGKPILRDEWQKFMENAFTLLNGTYEGDKVPMARFRLAYYESPNKFVLRCDDKDHRPFITDIVNMPSHKEAAKKRITLVRE